MLEDDKHLAKKKKKRTGCREFRIQGSGRVDQLHEEGDI